MTNLVSRRKLQKDHLTYGRGGLIWTWLVALLEPEPGPRFSFSYGMLY
jgi:hypothetical protein